VAFSIRDYQKKIQREEISRYMAEGGADDSTYTLGDFLKSKNSPETRESEDTSPESRPGEARSEESREDSESG
ncbi:MAG: hypothetical protein LBP29_05565, partial [Treponema sp.]|nr:hypothetical protein [Treponema sp.]